MDIEDSLETGSDLENYELYHQRIKILDNEESIKWHKRCSGSDFSWIKEDETIFNIVYEYCHTKCLEAHNLHVKRQKIKELFKDIDKEELINYLNGEF